MAQTQEETKMSGTEPIKTKTPKVDNTQNAQQARQEVIKAKEEPAESVYSAEELAQSAKMLLVPEKNA